MLPWILRGSYSRKDQSGPIWFFLSWAIIRAFCGLVKSNPVGFSQFYRLFAPITCETLAQVGLVWQIQKGPAMAAKKSDKVCLLYWRSWLIERQPH